MVKSPAVRLIIMRDLIVAPGPGLPDGLVVPAEALAERFARASGPGGQGVNTTDSRVQLTLDLDALDLSPEQQHRLRRGLGHRVVRDALTVDASEHRSQRQNRRAARERMEALLRGALAPPPPPRRPTRPSRGAVERRLSAKRHRSGIKEARHRPPADA